MIKVILFWGGVIGLLVTLVADVSRFRKSPRLATVSACLLAILCVALLGEAAARLYHWRAFGNNSWELERASYFNNNLLTRPYLLDGAVEYKFPTHLSGVRFSLATHSRLAYEVTIGVQRLGAALSQAGYLRSVKDDMREHGLAFPPFRRAVDTTDELIARIKRHAAPTPVVVFHAEWDDGRAFYNSWRAILRRHEIRFCEGVGSSVKTAELRGEAVRAPDGSHWNATGHAIAARALVQCLGPLVSRPGASRMSVNDRRQ
jgi:hypothetical protein